MAPKRTYVSVPGDPGDEPYPISGKNVMKVANWILKGVQKAHHEQTSLLETFHAWRHFTTPVVVPQYVEKEDDARFGYFDFDLRPVLWDVKDFAQQALAKLREKACASVVAECPGEPTFILVATDHLPSPHDWVDGFEYAFRFVWVLPRGDGSTLTIEDIPPKTDAFTFSKERLS